MKFFHRRRKERSEALVESADASQRLPQQEAHPSPSARPGPSARPLGTVQENSLGLISLNGEALDAVVDIVFVHGLTGGSSDTWLHKHSGVHWPAHLLPSDVPHARVLTFGYDADIVRFWNPASRNTVSNHAENMLGALARFREQSDSEYRKIIFVAHSLGGLVTQDALRISRNRAEKHIEQIGLSTVGIIFLGTPHHGSNLAFWGDYGTKLANLLRPTNRDLVRVLQPGSEMLANIQKDFHSLLRTRSSQNEEIKITCFYEELPSPIVGEIVPKHSAILPGYSSYGIHANHVDMTKFSGAHHPGYSDVLGELRRWVKAATEGRKVMDTQLTQEQKDCLQSLAFPEMDMRQNDVVDAADETCAWIISHNSYQQWLTARRGLLWIKGKPGAGKSTLVKYALNHVREQAHSTKVVLSSFFNGRGSPIEKSVLGLYRSLLHQILVRVPHLQPRLISVFKGKYETKGMPGKQWDWHERELQALLVECLYEVSQTYEIKLYIDALDELGEEVAVGLVDFFQYLLSKRLPDHATLSICFSCRHYPIIALEHGLEVCVEHENYKDIANYVEQKFLESHMDFEKARELEEEIVQRAEGTFQWVVLVVPLVLNHYRRGMSFQMIRAKIREIPPKLNSFYQEVVTSMKHKDPSSSLRLMQWICCAVTPLSLAELRFAMVADPDTPYNSLSECQESEEYAETDEDMERRLKDLSKGLAEVKQQHDRLVVQFIHQSVQDFFVQDGLRLLEDCNTDYVVGSVHFRIARSCVRFFCMKDFRCYEDIQATQYREETERRRRPSLDVDVGSISSEDTEETERRRRQSLDVEVGSISSENTEDSGAIEFPQSAPGFAFAMYSTQSWILHLLEAEKEQAIQGDVPIAFCYMLTDVMEHWVKLFRIKHWVKLFRIMGPYAYTRFAPDVGTTVLHVLSRHGLLNTLSAFLNSAEAKGNPTDCNGRTPLHLAALKGHTDVVSLLISRNEAKVNSKDCKGKTPLHFAANEGHKDVVSLLISYKEAKADCKDKSGRTPLSYAAEMGHEETVMLLLNRDDVDPDSKDRDNRTPLRRAAQGRHEAIVRLLMNRDDVDVNSKNALHGDTTLMFAASWGLKDMVSVLLSRTDVDAESKNNKGQTVLSRAAEHGFTGIVRLLLSREDVDVNSVDNDGQTPLIHAVIHGEESVVEMLIDQGSVDVNWKDSYGARALSYAAQYWDEGLTRLLMDVGALY